MIPHYLPPSKSPTFDFQPNLLGVALQRPSVDHGWNRLMAHRVVLSLFSLFGVCLKFLITKGCGEVREGEDKRYNPSHLTTFYPKDWLHPLPFSLLGMFSTPSLLIWILLGHQGLPQSHLMHGADCCWYLGTSPLRHLVRMPTTTCAYLAPFFAQIVSCIEPRVSLNHLGISPRTLYKVSIQ